MARERVLASCRTAPAPELTGQAREPEHLLERAPVSSQPAPGLARELAPEPGRARQGLAPAPVWERVSAREQAPESVHQALELAPVWEQESALSARGLEQAQARRGLGLAPA